MSGSAFGDTDNSVKANTPSQEEHDTLGAAMPGFLGSGQDSPYLVPIDDTDVNAEQGETLPHSIEAEQSVLGGLIQDDARFDDVNEIIDSPDFYAVRHAHIFEAIVELRKQDMPIDVITVAEKLNFRERLEGAGGIAYLSDLATQVPSSANVVAYANMVNDRSTLRKLIKTAGEIRNNSFSPGPLNSTDLLQQAEANILKIVEERPKEGGFEKAYDLVKLAAQKLNDRINADSDITGVPTGLSDLDEKTSGWQNGELIILAARPSMGKTALALNFVESCLNNKEAPVLVFSLEMPADSLVLRMLSSIGRIDQGRLRNGKLENDDWPKLEMAAGKLRDLPLFIDDTAGLTPSDIRARVKRIVREHGNPAMIMVDYLQLMHVAGSTEGRTQEISEISRSMKALAKEYDCPVICLSQLNRGVEMRPNKRPMNSDLRESGAIEQDADVILFIYRDEYYNEDSEEKGIAELIIGKQRNGEIGVCRSAFIGRYTRFDNLAPEYFEQQSGP